MSGITINAEAMQSVVSKAVLDGLTEEHRNLVLEEAAKFLITPIKDTYGRAGLTPLQQAFNAALDQAVMVTAH